MDEFLFEDNELSGKENSSNNDSIKQLIVRPAGQEKLWSLPCKYFKYENDYGSFKVYIYLNNYYKITYVGHLVTEKYDYLGHMKISVNTNGAVNIWALSGPYDFGREKRRPSGFIITDKDEIEEIKDYIKKLKEISLYMRKVHQRQRYLKKMSRTKTN